MKNTEIRALSESQLKERILSEKEGLKKMKFAHKITDIENPLQIKNTRRFIARLETALRQQEKK